MITTKDLKQFAIAFAMAALLVGFYAVIWLAWQPASGAIAATHGQLARYPEADVHLSDRLLASPRIAENGDRDWDAVRPSLRIRPAATVAPSGGLRTRQRCDTRNSI